MNSSEFEMKIMLLGWTPRTLGDELGIEPRTIHAWSKEEPPPDDIADQVNEWWISFLDLLQSWIGEKKQPESDLPMPIQSAAKTQAYLIFAFQLQNLY